MPARITENEKPFRVETAKQLRRNTFWLVLLIFWNFPAGIIILQVPHQVAQKSTRTGTGELRTSASNVLSVTSLSAIVVCVLCLL